MNIIQKYEQTKINEIIQNKEIQNFAVGDTVKVLVRVIDTSTERLQPYEGVVIAKRNKMLSSSFVVRKISYGEGVERSFMIYSPLLHSVILIKKGKVRRAKLYYLRSKSGKASKIKEKIF